MKENFVDELLFLCYFVIKLYIYVHRLTILPKKMYNKGSIENKEGKRGIKGGSN